MKIKLVADSSANMKVLDGAEFSSVPLSILLDDKAYVDNDDLDVPALLDDLRVFKGKTGTACPSVADWMDAFDNADVVLGVAITSNLSGCYNAASIAAQEYMETYPDRKVFILDSLSTGPEMELILEKYVELIAAGKSFEEIVEEVKAYSSKTHLLFSLESLANLARNGRVSPLVAKAAGILGIRVVGKASDVGTLEPLHKPRGEKKALQTMVSEMEAMGYTGGKIRISHTFNSTAAEALVALLKERFPACTPTVRLNTGLCSYYSEEGGMLVGFEG